MDSLAGVRGASLTNVEAFKKLIKGGQADKNAMKFSGGKVTLY